MGQGGRWGRMRRSEEKKKRKYTRKRRFAYRELKRFKLHTIQRPCEGWGSQRIGRAKHLQISTNVRADIHPRSRKMDRYRLVYLLIFTTLQTLLYF